MSDPILRRHEVERETGRSRSAIYRDMAEGSFPRPLRIGKRAVGWRASAIEAWKTERAELSA